MNWPWKKKSRPIEDTPPGFLISFAFDLGDAPRTPEETTREALIINQVQAEIDEIVKNLRKPVADGGCSAVSLRDKRNVCLSDDRITCFDLSAFLPPDEQGFGTALNLFKRFRTIYRNLTDYFGNGECAVNCTLMFVALGDTARLKLSEHSLRQVILSTATV